MKKIRYTTKPNGVEDRDLRTSVVNMNMTPIEVVEEVRYIGEDGEEHVERMATTQYEADAVVVEKPVTYARIVDALVRDRYTLSDELALLRQRESKREEFAEYNAYVERCKEMAKEVEAE